MEKKGQGVKLLAGIWHLKADVRGDILKMGSDCLVVLLFHSVSHDGQECPLLS